MAVSCAVVRLPGALDFAWVAYVTASPASTTNAMPPGAYGASEDLRSLEERPKSSQGWPATLPSVLPAIAVMPSPEPLGRSCGMQPAFGLIASWIAPVAGLVASSLYSLTPLCVAL